MLEINGLDKAIKKIGDLADKAQSLEGERSVSMSEILTPSFIERYTSFSTVNEMIDASGFEVKNQEDFNAIPSDKWDIFISSISPFQSWGEMLSEAGKEWAANKLGL